MYFFIIRILSCVKTRRLSHQPSILVQAFDPWTCARKKGHKQGKDMDNALKRDRSVIYHACADKSSGNRLLPNFAQAITLVWLIYVHNLVAIGCRGLLGTCVKYNTSVPCKRIIHLPFHPFPSRFFLRTSTGRTPEPILMVDGSNDASWHKEVPFGYANNEKDIQGSTAPQTVAFFQWFTDSDAFN